MAWGASCLLLRGSQRGVLLLVHTTAGSQGQHLVGRGVLLSGGSICNFSAMSLQLSAAPACLPGFPPCLASHPSAQNGAAFTHL